MFTNGIRNRNITSGVNERTSALATRIKHDPIIRRVSMGRKLFIAQSGVITDHLSQPRHSKTSPPVGLCGHDRYWSPAVETMATDRIDRDCTSHEPNARGRVKSAPAPPTIRLLIRRHPSTDIKCPNDWDANCRTANARGPG